MSWTISVDIELPYFRGFKPTWELSSQPKQAVKQQNKHYWEYLVATLTPTLSTSIINKCGRESVGG